ncbi:MAG: DHH family phosphoesterase [Nanoarchaeota archaeon]|nr:DHH family phosphoesterase [Nanoarchaeota archaeon]
MLDKRHIERIREELDSCKRPIFFFHDDADGLCSFLLFYRHITEGKGVIVKMTPKIDSANYTRKVKEYEPDKVFILDIAVVEQDFLDDMHEMKIPVVWVDHHNPLKRDNVMYFNPRLNDIKDNTCVTAICYHVVKNDIWIAMVGSIGDWQMPDYRDDFIAKYPKLLDPSVFRPEEALFSQPIGNLVRVFSFVLKGKTDDVVKCMKILTRVSDPDEILHETTPPGRFLFKRHSSIKDHYDVLLKKAKDQVPKEELFIYIYKGEKFSFSSELSNELLFNYPSKIILVGREKSGEIKYSIRASEINVSLILAKALDGVEGFGGGHEHACGAVVKEKFNKRFIKQFKRALGAFEEASP